jgi:ribosome-binding ATPase
MPLQVGVVGLPNAGKTTLFNALTRAGAEVTSYASVVEKANVGMAVIPDDRLGRLALLAGSTKTTPAAIRVVDVPATSADLPGGLRQADALLAVVDGFSDGADPAADLESLKLEMVVADRDHVERRLEKVRKEAKSGDPARRQELALLEALLEHLESGRPLSDVRHVPDELEPLTTKPLIVVENGPGGIDAKLEMELAELPPEEAAEFRSGPSALEEVVRRLKETLGLISFFTIGDTEARASTLRHGETALDAAESIHSDIARGFIRAEVIRWDDLLESGSHAEAARRGLQRLEGKTYVVEDGDVINVRFNV